MKLRLFAATVMAIALGLLTLSSVAFANPAGNAAWAPFDSASWVNGTGNPGFGLVTTSNAAHPDGGIRLKTSSIPTNPSKIYALSFDYNPNQSGGSGGSPRMVVQFSDGGNGQLRPITWTANTWNTVDGMSGSNWDNSGGSGYKYGTDWQGILDSHQGATITGIYVVNDSGWAFSTGEQVTLDNITVNNLIATGPGNKN